MGRHTKLTQIARMLEDIRDNVTELRASGLLLMQLESVMVRLDHVLDELYDVEAQHVMHVETDA